MGKSQKNYMSIKSKLMAAVAMLLVASFMVVSSTYAWFTLSTAPEIKGIKTTIGANGNLEIALAVGDSANPFNKENVKTGVGTSGDYSTWGNLVDVGEDKYGMQNITLLPSRLNIATAEGILGASPLSTPLYGADGRITSLVNQTVYGAYDEDNNTFFVDEKVSGLAAIGTASGMTAQQSGYRNAKAAFDTNLSSAKLKASGSLNKYGSSLASTLVNYAITSDETATFNISAVANIIDELELAQGLLETAIRNYFGVAVAKALESDDANYAIAAKIVETADLATMMNGGAVTVDGIGTYTFPAVTGLPINEMYTKVVAIDDALEAANTAMTTAGENGGAVDLTAANKTQIRAILIDSGVINYNNITVSGVSIDEIKTDEGKQQLAAAVLNDGLVVEMPAGSGVYADIAEITGNYQSNVTIEKIEYNGMPLENVPAAMKTTITSTINVKGTMPTSPASASTANAEITDFYGYAIDLVFRTNAANSNLMLQTTPAQRIYSDSTNVDTLGGGSAMTFNPTTVDFTPEQMQNLMRAIRIVFTTTEVITTTGTDADGQPTETTSTTRKILAVAGLDVANAVRTAEGGYTANIMLLEYTVEPETTNGEGEPAQLIKLTETTDAQGVKSYVFKANESTKNTADHPDVVQTLMALNQNEATVLSAIVYLDGESVTNADVANAASSMTGSMNLQFSSDAELIPMGYTPLENGN